jgi:hypothetical protein
MTMEFDPRRDMEALANASRPGLTDADRALLEKERAHQDEARRELRARAEIIRNNVLREKEDWVYAALKLVAPLWAVRWTMEKKRGWILRIFSVTMEHWVFDTYTEIFIVRKGGKTAAVKLFRWNGTHTEGKFGKWAA